MLEVELHMSNVLASCKSVYCSGSLLFSCLQLMGPALRVTCVSGLFLMVVWHDRCLLLLETPLRMCLEQAKDHQNTLLHLCAVCKQHCPGVDFRS